MARDIVVILSTPQGREIVKQHCREAKLPIALFQELVEAEVKQTGKKRKHGITDDFDDILDRWEF